MPDQPMEERIREALEKHAGYGYGFDKSAFRTKMTCSCGEWSEYLEPGKSTEAKFRAHTVAVVAGIVREAQAKALEDSADHLDPQTHINPDGTAKPTLDTVLMVATHATAPWLRQIARGIRNNGEGANHV